MKGRAAFVVLVLVATAGFGIWWLSARHDHPADAGKTENPPERSPRPSARTAAGLSTATTPPQDPAGQPDVAASDRAAMAERLEPVVPARSAPAEGRAACDDGDLCTLFDRYEGEVCRGRPVDCDDDNPLTVDSCTGDGCLHAFVPGAFDAVDPP